MQTIKKFLPDHLKKILYHAHVSSHLSYGTILWGPMINSSSLNKLSKLQNKMLSTFNINKS